MSSEVETERARILESLFGEIVSRSWTLAHGARSDEAREKVLESLEHELAARRHPPAPLPSPPPPPSAASDGGCHDDSSVAPSAADSAAVGEVSLPLGGSGATFATLEQTWLTEPERQSLLDKFEIHLKVLRIVFRLKDRQDISTAAEVERARSSTDNSNLHDSGARCETSVAGSSSIEQSQPAAVSAVPTTSRDTWRCYSSAQRPTLAGDSAASLRRGDGSQAVAVPSRIGKPRFTTTTTWTAEAGRFAVSADRVAPPATVFESPRTAMSSSEPGPFSGADGSSEERRGDSGADPCPANRLQFTLASRVDVVAPSAAVGTAAPQRQYQGLCADDTSEQWWRSESHRLRERLSSFDRRRRLPVAPPEDPCATAPRRGALGHGQPEPDGRVAPGGLSPQLCSVGIGQAPPCAIATAVSATPTRSDRGWSADGAPTATPAASASQTPLPSALYNSARQRSAFTSHESMPQDPGGESRDYPSINEHFRPTGVLPHSTAVAPSSLSTAVESLRARLSSLELLVSAASAAALNATPTARREASFGGAEPSAGATAAHVDAASTTYPPSSVGDGGEDWTSEEEEEEEVAETEHDREGDDARLGGLLSPPTRAHRGLFSRRRCHERRYLKRRGAAEAAEAADPCPSLLLSNRPDSLVATAASRLACGGYRRSSSEALGAMRLARKALSFLHRRRLLVERAKRLIDPASRDGILVDASDAAATRGHAEELTPLLHTDGRTPRSQRSLLNLLVDQARRTRTAVGNRHT